MTYDYYEQKSVIALWADLTPGVALNVAAHLALALGAAAPVSIMGRAELTDGSGTVHRGISKYPVIITKAKQGPLRRAITEARGHKSILMADYPREMLATGPDDELAAALATVSEPDLVYYGAIFYGIRSEVDGITGKFSLWK